jgi:hypothetical protein
MVPKVKYPYFPLNHSRAVIVANIIKIWKNSGLLQTLQNHLKILKNKGVRSNLNEAQ